MSVETRNVLILGILEFLQTDSIICSCFGTSFQIRYLLIMLLSDAVCSDLLTEALPGTQVKY